jgi:beta-glucanase (GH16 family)
MIYAAEHPYPARHNRVFDSGAILITWLVFFALATSASAQTWTLAWSDEFNGAANSAINPKNWQYDTGILNVNNEVEYYCAPSSSTAPCNPASPNAYIDGNGHLAIQALRINSSGAPYSSSWTSARLTSANNLQSFQYGRIESSMSLPLGPGIWPAFWALGTNITSVGWPASGEMDFMENVPLSSGLGPNTISSTMHGGVSSGNCYCGGNGMGKKYSFPSNSANGPDVTTFHTYGAIWSPNMVQFYVDDPANIFFVRTVNDVPSGLPWDFNHPFFLLLNLAVGGTGSWPGPPDNTTPSPAVMLVDYVRVYTASAVPAPSMTAPSISVTAGQSGSSTVSLTSTAGSGRVYLACSTNAPKTSCAIQSLDPLNQYTVDFSSAASAKAMVSVTTTANTSARTSLPLGFGGLGIGLLGLAFLSRRRRGTTLLYAAGLLLWLCWIPSCGGSGASASGGNGGTPNGTPPGSYTITVNAYTVSNAGGTPDAAVNIPLSVK